MNRRGFLHALSALALAPFLPWQSPWEYSRKEFYGSVDISRSTFAQWQSQPQTPFSSTAFDNLQRVMRDVHARCKVG